MDIRNNVKDMEQPPEKYVYGHRPQQEYDSDGRRIVRPERKEPERLKVEDKPKPSPRPNEEEIGQCDNQFGHRTVGRKIKNGL